MLHPKITIVMPVYNGANFMKKAIDSALAQTYDNIEIVVVNDGSNDGGATSKIAQSYGSKITFIDRSKNKGIAYTLNECIDNAKGDYITWLSHDDAYKPMKIAAQVEFLNELAEKYPNDISRICLCGGIETINLNDEVIRPRTMHSQTNVFRTRKQILLDNIRSYEIAGCSILIPKKAFDICGGFSSKWKTMQDTDMWFRLMISGYVFFYQNVYLTLKRHHENETGVLLRDVCIDERNRFHEQLAVLMQNMDDLQDWRYFINVGVAHRRMQYKKAANLSYHYAHKLHSSFDYWCLFIPKSIYAALYGTGRSLAKKIYWKFVVKA